MGKIERFEELIAWQKARELTSSSYEILRQTGEAARTIKGLGACIEKQRKGKPE